MKLTKTTFAISAISIFAVACKSTGFNFGGETTNLTDIKKVCVVPHKVEFRNIALENLYVKAYKEQGFAVNTIKEAKDAKDNNCSHLAEYKVRHSDGSEFSNMSLVFYRFNKYGVKVKTAVADWRNSNIKLDPRNEEQALPIISKVTMMSITGKQ